MKKIINLEINEISPNLIKDYIDNHRNSNLANLKYKRLLSIYKTKALDVPKKKLYPSQTWASFNTGKSFDEHKCYWYSDYLDSELLLWQKLVKNNINVGVIGSIHSSKYPKDLFSNKKYKFLLPDCFSNKSITKPDCYKYFQSFNNNLVSNSARITGLKSLIILISGYLIQILKSPRNFGISFFSLKLILNIIFLSIRYRNKEFIRMAQFPLLCSIFINLFSRYKPEYSTIFSNHIAGNMHRYWYAHDINSFKNKKKYKSSWIKRNKEAVNIGIDLLDRFLGVLMEKKIFENCTFLITSSMGQEANPEFDSKYLSNFDGKIHDMDLFIEKLSNYQRDEYGLVVNYNHNRNMAPQYGFDFSDQKGLDLNFVKTTIESFFNTLGIKTNIDKEGYSIVISIDPYTDIEFQENYDLKKANAKYSKFGFKFFKIEDHHSGSHFEDGSLIVINSSKKLDSCIKKVENKNWINYLKFNDIVIDYFND